MKYQIKSVFLGKVRLEDGNSSTILDENTPQDVLAKHYDTMSGKGFIELVADTAAKLKDNAKA